jgi:hypothetical protein
MKRYWFKIQDDLIVDSKEVTEVPEGFIECENTFGADTIYYKVEGTAITEVIGEAVHEAKARERVDDFVSRLNKHLV